MDIFTQIHRKAAACTATLATTSALGPGGALALAEDYKTAAFEAKSIADALKGLGLSEWRESAEVTLSAPDFAENGAVVPVSVSTSLPAVRSVLIMVENNPAVLSAKFEVSDAKYLSFSTRLKMGQTSNAYAGARTCDARALLAQKEVKVTLGGSGG